MLAEPVPQHGKITNVGRWGRTGTGPLRRMNRSHGQTAVRWANGRLWILCLSAPTFPDISPSPSGIVLFRLLHKESAIMEFAPTVLSTALFVNQAAIAHFICAICYNVMKDPTLVCASGHNFCRTCLQRAMERSKNCPTCSESITRDLVLNLTVKKMILESQVFCYTRLLLLETAAAAANSDEKADNATSTGCPSSSSSSSSSKVRNVRPRVDHCTWEGKLEDAVTHFHECGYAGVKCSYAGCNEVVARRDMAEHEASCLHRIEPCGMCEQQVKIAELAQHQLVCLKRQVDCDNHGCDARIAFDKLADHKANDCGREIVGCPFASMGCAALMLRKDVEAHEDAALRQHNRLLLMKAKEQQEEYEEVKDELEQVKKTHKVAMLELEVVKLAHDELMEEVEELRGQVGYEIVLRVKHAVLTGREPVVPRYPSHPTRVCSEDKVVQGLKVSIYVQTKNINPEDQDHYGVYLEVRNGPFPCKATCIWELVHYDGNPQSAVKDEHEYTFTKFEAWGHPRFISKARLASADNNPYVKDGYVTFKCTVKIVDV